MTFLPESRFREVVGPLFDEGLIEALEFDTDARWHTGRVARRLPRWVESILDLYSEAGLLYGHAVWLSFLGAEWGPRQVAWMAHLARECKRRPVRHLTEHLGFCAAGKFDRGTLMSCPLDAEAERICIDRLARLAKASRAPVGVEQMATVLSPDDAHLQGPFLRRVLDEVDGFMILDAHNIYVQAVNTGTSYRELLRTFPLDRVKEIHLSGGAWYVNARGRRIRMDSHDGPVPREVWDELPHLLTSCPNVEFVLLERRGETLFGDPHLESYRSDFRRLYSLVKSVRWPEQTRRWKRSPKASLVARASQPAAQSLPLAAYQAALAELLYRCLPGPRTKELLLRHPASRPYRAYVESLDPDLLEVFALLQRRWAVPSGKASASVSIPARQLMGGGRAEADPLPAAPVVAEPIRRSA